ncbi:hypothetical protein V8F20_003529 [Naviculisporaceae sp. PSN 640]
MNSDQIRAHLGHRHRRSKTKSSYWNLSMWSFRICSHLDCCLRLIGTNLHSKHDRECFYARAVYRTWRSWKSPASSDHRTPWDGNKCPLKSCDSRFKDISSMLTHLEEECKALRSKVDTACSQVRSTERSTPTALISQTVAGSDESRPRCSKCHSTWCRTKSLLENNKGLKRIRSLHDSLLGRRKSSRPLDTIVELAAGSPSRSSSSATQPPSYSESQAAGHGAYQSLPPMNPACELEGPVPQTLRPVEVEAVLPSELDGAGAFLPVELPASFPAFGDARPEAASAVRGRSSKSFTGVSDMSDTTASTHGRDSLVSVCSRPTVSSSSTTASLPPICTTIKPLNTQGAIFTDFLTQSPEGDEDGGFSSEVLFANRLGHRVETPSIGAGRFSSDHTMAHTTMEHSTMERAFTPSPNSPSLTFSMIPSTSSSVDRQESCLPTQTTSTATMSHLNPGASTNPSPLSPEATVSPGQAFLEKLESLKLTLYNLRDTEKKHRTNKFLAGSILNLPNEVTLLGGLDSLGKLLGGAGEGRIPYKFCFAYLSLAMAVEIKQRIPETYHAALRDDFERFVDTEGEAGLTWRFLNVAHFYLKGLNACNPAPGHGRMVTDEETTRRVHVNFQLMRVCLRGNPFPRLPSSSRQDSYSSTASTLVNGDVDAQVLLPRHSPSRTPSFDSTLGTSSDEGEANTAWQQYQSSPRKRRKCEPVETSCPPCGFYPAAGLNQQKKLSRHRATRKHRRITEELRIGCELQPSSAPLGGTPPTPRVVGTSPPAITTPPRLGADTIFHCPLRHVSGCSTTFSRKDNIKSHLKRKHREIIDENTPYGRR